MNDRENLISLLRKTGYERMPVDFLMTPLLNKKFSSFINETGYEYPQSPFVGLPHPAEKYPKPQDFWKQYYDHDFNEGTRFSNYGVASEPGSAACLHMTRMYHPLEKMDTLEQLAAFPFPEYIDAVTDSMVSTAETARQDGKFSIGNMACTIWETAWYARGMEVLMMDMLTQPELAEFVLDKVTENAVIKARNFARAGADGLYLGDDIGMQSSILMGLDAYREFLKPRLGRIIGEAKKINPDIIIFYHSCGYIEPFIDDLIEVGIDVLNPVQPECMDFETIYKKYGDRLSFCGTIGTQTSMPFGTPESIKKEIKERLDFVGSQGGLLICPTHILEPEVPVENLVAYIEACKNYTPAIK